MLLAVADYLPRTCRVPGFSFVTFLVQAKELLKRGSSLATRGLPVTYTPCLKTFHSYFRFVSSRGALVFPMCRLPTASFCVALGAGASSFPWSVGGGLLAPLGILLLAAVALWPDMLSTWLFARSHYSHGLIGLGSFASGTKSCAIVSTV